MIQLITQLTSSRYNKLAGNIKQLANRISLLDPRDPYRAQKEKALLDKLYSMAIITSTAKFSDCNKVTVSAFCRRRLPIVMCRLKMSETVKEAVTFVEQGHVRVGPETITDPAFLVTRNMEDFVTWVDTSKIKRKILKYNDKVRVWRLAEWVGSFTHTNIYGHIVGRFRFVVKKKNSLFGEDTLFNMDGCAKLLNCRSASLTFSPILLTSL